MLTFIVDNKLIFGILLILALVQTMVYLARQPATIEDGVPTEISISKKFYLANVQVLNKTVPEVQEVPATCQVPTYQPDDPMVQPFIKKMKPVTCTKLQEADLIHIYSDGHLEINTKKANKFKHLVCKYQPIRRKKEKSDDTNLYGQQTVLQNKAFVKADVVHVKCDDGKKRVYEDLRPLVHKRQLKPEEQKKTEDRPSVLIFGMDSLSRLNSLRSLKKLNGLLSEKLGAHVFNLHTKVGRNTKPNMTPLLVGKHIDPWNNTGPEISYKSPLTKDGFIDNWPFIWKEFSNHNYTTAYGEDEPVLSTFNYKQKGFSKAPTHHYLRPFWVAWRKVKKEPLAKKSSAKCFLNKPKYFYILNWVVDLARTYKNDPFFGFVLTTFTHRDINEHALLDEPVFKMVETMHKEHLLNNTILIILGDHGTRFGNYRRTEMGRVEDMMPYLAIALPKNLRKKYPQLEDALRYNTNSLTSWFDLHATLEDIVKIDFGSKHLESHEQIKRGMSLFKKIPRRRSCSEAGIPLAYCSCLRPKELTVDEPRVVEAAKAFIQSINKRIVKNGQCTPVSLKSIKKAFRLDFKEEAQFLPSISDEGFLLQIIAKPTGGLYETMMVYNEKTKSYSNSVSISRLDEYAGKGWCVKDAFLEQFCDCGSKKN